MKCLLCKNLNLRHSTEMSRIGYGKCEIDKQPAHSVSFLFVRECEGFDSVSETVKFKRTTWAEQLNRKALV